MAWKILSALAAVCLAGSAFFAWKNQERLKNERAREEYTKKNLTSIQEHKKSAEEAKTKHTTELAEAGKELDKVKGEVTDMAAKAQEKEQELAQLKTNLEGVAKVVKELKDRIAEAGDITGLLATIKNL
jgi:peptidoglycan hydrolase CwlO-like protein